MCDRACKEEDATDSQTAVSDESELLLPEELADVCCVFDDDEEHLELAGQREAERSDEVQFPLVEGVIDESAPDVEQHSGGSKSEGQEAAHGYGLDGVLCGLCDEHQQRGHDDEQLVDGEKLAVLAEGKRAEGSEGEGEGRQ